MAISAQIGDKRICKKCGQEYAHFGALMRLCREHLNEYGRESIRKRSRNPEWRDRQNWLRRQKRVRNKRAVEEILKTCRCKNCREADPRTLRFYDETGRLNPITEIVDGAHSIKVIREFLRKCVVLCFNCRAKQPRPRAGNEVAA